MSPFQSKFKPAVTTALWLIALAGAAAAQPAAPTGGTDDLLEALRRAGPQEAAPIETRLRAEWSRSGSPAMDLLLKRGRDAMEAGEHAAAVAHLSALTDHAPDFAEGWVARALAFYNLDEYGLALADLEQALALNPQHFGALQGVGAIMEQLGRPQLAWRAYQQVLAIHPHHAEVTSAMERLSREVQGLEL